LKQPFFVIFLLTALKIYERRMRIVFSFDPVMRPDGQFHQVLVHLNLKISNKNLPDLLCMSKF